MLPAPFLVLFSSDDKSEEKRILRYLELRGDKIRDIKNESTVLKFEKQNCN